MKYTFTFSLLIIICSSLEAQDLKFSIKNEMKKELMNKVNPSKLTPNSQMKQAPVSINGANKDNLLEFSKKYRKGSGGEEFDSQYKVNPHAITYSSDIPINQIKPGTVVPVYTGGHFVLVNPATNALGLVKPSGMNLSGGGKKKMSKRTRMILEQVFGVQLEDKNELE